MMVDFIGDVAMITTNDPERIGELDFLCANFPEMFKHVRQLHESAEWQVYRVPARLVRIDLPDSAAEHDAACADMEAHRVRIDSMPWFHDCLVRDLEFQPLGR